MIPLQLMVRNFLSYGATIQTIDFEPYHLICFTGKNGHGKSALLDAITWALWGQARKIGGITRSDEHLMRLGQTHMMVTLDFLCNKNRYRVNRELVLYANKKSHTELSLGVYKEETHTYLSLNEKTSRATQEKITELLGIDYEGCVNSIFLRQGQSNEFSKRAPQERKEILASMLGLDHYEEVRKQALEKARTLIREKEQLSHLIEVLEKESISSKELEQHIVHLAEQLAKNAEQLRFFTQKQHVGEEKRQSLLIKQQETTTLLQQTLRIRQEYSEKGATLATNLALWRTTRRQRKGEQTIAAFEEELEKINNALARQRAQDTRASTLKEHLVTLTAQEQTVRESLLHTYTQKLSIVEKNAEREQLHHEQLKQKKTDLQKALQATTQNLTATSRKITQYAQTLSEKERLAQELTIYKNSHARLSHFAQRWQLRLEKNEQEQAACQLQEKALPSSNPQCPLCQQLIPPAKHAQLHQETVLRKKRLEHQAQRLVLLCRKLEEKRLTLEHKREELSSCITVLEKITLEHSILSARAADYTQEHEKIEESLRKTDTEEAQSAALSQNAIAERDAWIAKKMSIFTEDTTLTELKGKRESIEEELKKITFTSIDIQKLHEQKALIIQQKEKAQLLHNQLTQQDERRATITLLVAQLKKLKKELFHAETVRASAPDLERELLATNRALEQVKIHLQALAQQKDALLMEKGSREQQKIQQEQRTAAQKAYLEKKSEIERLLEDYNLIGSALSKNGLQALIIENAIPEIEAEANSLLAQLTDNQAHVIFESIRDLKGGGTKETLDIKISDALGIRPYELFSGGEAFRIDFAIRIAISKLLARRSGTSLQTLIIDEGFGSQDEEGLAMIMEALYKIQDDFEKIIVVSHLTEMKTEFPTNFFIQKGSTGSTVTVLQQG